MASILKKSSKRKVRAMSNLSKSKPETTESLTLIPNSTSSPSIKRSPRLLRVRKKNPVSSAVSATFTRNYAEEVLHENENGNQVLKSNSTRPFGTKKAVADSFPGVPLHIVTTPRGESEEAQKKILKSFLKQIEVAKNELDNLYSLERATVNRIQNIETREQQLLKSCEKLKEISVTTNPQDEKRSTKGGRKTDPILTSPDPNTLQIDIRDVQVCELLGTGASGATVYLANVNGWCCAMKELPRNISNEMDSEAFEKEMALLYQIPRHPNIARYLFHKKLRGRYCLFMSRYSGTLRDEIDRRRKRMEYFSTREIIKIAYEVANGLTFLHAEKIIHRDMKSDNVFVAVNKQGDIRDVTIGDFDTAKRLGVSARPKSSVGTPGFMAPEVLDACGRNFYTYSADIFSYGMILFELMALDYPYKECASSFAVSTAILDGYEPELSDTVRTMYKPLLPLWRECICKNPEERISAANIRTKLLEIRSFLNANRYTTAPQTLLSSNSVPAFTLSSTPLRGAKSKGTSVDSQICITPKESELIEASEMTEVSTTEGGTKKKKRKKKKKEEKKKSKRRRSKSFNPSAFTDSTSFIQSKEVQKNMDDPEGSIREGPSA